MPLDAHGTEIRIGDRVRHIHNPAECPKNMPHWSDLSEEAKRLRKHWHNFYGSAEVLDVGEVSVRVKKINSSHVPVHLSRLVEVVAE